jgi:hypothetical protein
MKFSHPLARAAKLWRANFLDGAEQPILVIVTTIELDAGNKNFKENLVKTLGNAAQEYLKQSQVATGYVLINRMRDW